MEIALCRSNVLEHYKTPANSYLGHSLLTSGKAKTQSCCKDQGFVSTEKTSKLIMATVLFLLSFC